MKKAADVLYLLATFSLRTNMIEKAHRYADSGHKLFPNDLRLTEVYAYVLLLKGEFGAAETVLSQTEASTRNLEFLRGRAAMLNGLPLSERQDRLRRYLTF